mmetsp:Transcript_23084/g.32566  ORF Transcript_23084/g.32566 Transcript_23084/m.32566 type:complete len:203 (+) Transcript_23084:478-1086(+)
MKRFPEFSNPFLPSTQSLEVRGCFRNGFVEQLHHDLTCLVASDRDVEKYSALVVSTCVFGTSCRRFSLLVCGRSQRFLWLAFLGSAFFFKLAAVCDDNLGLGGSTLRALAFDSLDNVHTVDDFAKHAVFSVQVWGSNGSNEELGTVGMGSSVGHGQQARGTVLQLEVFVAELAAVNRFTASTISTRKVTSLKHEPRDDAMEL